MFCTVTAASSKETIARLQFKAEFSWSLLLCAGLVFCSIEIIVFFPDDCVLFKYYTVLQKGYLVLRLEGCRSMAVSATP